MEPVDLWSSRLSSRYAERGPWSIRQKVTQDQATGSVSSWKLDDAGDRADVWYDDVVAPRAVNFAELEYKAATYGISR